LKGFDRVFSDDVPTGVVVPDSRSVRMWLIVLTAVLAAWTLLVMSGGVAWASTDGKSGDKGSSHSTHATTHSTTHAAAHKADPPSRHRTTATAGERGHRPAASSKSESRKAPATAVSATADSADAPTADAAKTRTERSAAHVAKTAEAKAPKTRTDDTDTPEATTVKTPTAATAATSLRAVSTASSPSSPSTPQAPTALAGATVAALGEEVQRKSAVATQLSPGYLVNAVVNAVGGGLAGTAAHLSPGLAYGVREVTQFTRQMVGLAFDIGTIGASLVNNIAVLAAHTIGPDLMWGLPYHALTAVAVVAGDVSKVLTGTPLDATSTGPFAVDYGVFDALAFLTPWASPPGANDPSITVTAEHPLPVILLNGTSANQADNWSVGAPALANAGYKVYTFNFGNNTSDPNFPIQSIGDIAKSAEQLSAEVDMVLAQTGASKVILIGHSQGGGILPEYYINKLGGDSKVSQLIGIAPSNHGTNVDGLTGLLAIPILGTLIKGLVNQGGAAWLQQANGSSLVHQVYGNGDTRPGVIYDTIASTNDEVVTPYAHQALDGPNVTNVVVQNQDPGFAAGHLGIVVNYGVWQDILGMLADNPAASPQLPAAAVA